MPIHPCGMVMDYARVCGTSTMRLWADREIETPIRWFRAAPGALIYPGPHRFINRNWQGHEKYAGLGEPYPLRRKYDKGQNIPFYPGLGKCGPDYAFVSGGLWDSTPHIQTNADGTADCCPRVPGIHDPVGGEARPRARWPNGLTGRAVARVVSTFGAGNGLAYPVPAVAAPAGIQFVPNALRSVVPSLALPVAQLRAGPTYRGLADAVAQVVGRQGIINRWAGLADAVGRGSARQGTPNKQEGRARSAARPSGYQGPVPLPVGTVSGTGKPAAVWTAGYVINDVVPAIALPIASWQAGFIMQALMPAIALPIADMKAGITYLGEASPVGLPFGAFAAGLSLEGLADAVAKPSGTQGGSSPSGYIGGSTAGPAMSLVNIPKPAGTVAGTYLVACVSAFDSFVPFLGPPAGWTFVFDASIPGGPRVGYFTKIASGSEPASYPFSSTPTAQLSGAIAAYGPGFAIADTSIFGMGTSSTAMAPGVTVGGSGGIAVLCVNPITSNVTAGPAGYTARLSVASATPRAYIYDKAVVSGATGSAAATLAAASPYAAVIIVIR